MATNDEHEPEFSDDDTTVDVYALFVLEDIPHSVINQAIPVNADKIDNVYYLWLADSYDNLPAIGNEHPEATRTPISPAWSSPFVGKTLREAADFVRNAPKPLCQVFFAVLEKERYEKDNRILLCKIVDGEIQAFPYDGDEVSIYFIGHDRDTWGDTWERLRESPQSPVE